MPAKKKDVEEVVVERGPKRHIAEIVLSREPLQKDLYIGSYVYRDATETLVLEDANPGFASDLEGLMEGDLSISDGLGGTSFVSVNENPRDWVINSIKSNEFSGHPYGIGRVFDLDEAE